MGLLHTALYIAQSKRIASRGWSLQKPELVINLAPKAVKTQDDLGGLITHRKVPEPTFLVCSPHLIAISHIVSGRP